MVASQVSNPSQACSGRRLGSKSSWLLQPPVAGDEGALGMLHSRRNAVLARAGRRREEGTQRCRQFARRISLAVVREEEALAVDQAVPPLAQQIGPVVAERSPGRVARRDRAPRLWPSADRDRPDRPGLPRPRATSSRRRASARRASWSCHEKTPGRAGGGSLSSPTRRHQTGHPAIAGCRKACSSESVRRRRSAPASRSRSSRRGSRRARPPT